MAKGSQFERDICRQLSLWWTQDLLEPRDNIFWRTSNSGGRATVQRQKGRSMKVHCGDLCAIDPIGQPFLDLFAIEIKRGYASATFHDLLDKPKTAKTQTFEKWIQQARDSRDQAGVPFWLLITRRDRRETLVTFPEALVVGKLNWVGGAHICFSEGGFSMGLRVLPLTEFLCLVEPADLR